jgi:hypothetical protein
MCGAQGRLHSTAEAAEQEWQRLAGYEEALRDILHGPCAAPGWTDRKIIRLFEQTAHDALYGADDTEHVGNWAAWMEKEFVKAITDPEDGNIIEVEHTDKVGKAVCRVCKRSLPDIGFEDGVCVDCTH